MIADTMSRVPCKPSSLVGENNSALNHADNNQTHFSSLLDDLELADCFLVHPEFDDEGRHPLLYNTIHEYQNQDQSLNERSNNDPGRFPRKQFDDIELICYLPEQNQPDDWKIAVPEGMLAKLITWYHRTLSHVGMSRLKRTINQHFYNAKMGSTVEKILKTCDPCQ